ncbi:MAG: NAD-dependent epimerase/dehydratase family protein [Patescibacteria group bacterium]
MAVSKGKILITGVAGFIGSNLADRLLAAGYKVLGLDNLAYGPAHQVPKEVEFHRVDVSSQSIYPLFEGVDAVFHLAAKNQLLDCQKDPVETMQINVVGTTNVFEAAKRAGVRKVVYAQSSAVEEGDDRLKGFYAISKLTDAMIADGYHAAFGVTMVGVRYFNVYGPRQDYRRLIPPVMSAFIIKLLKGERPTIYEGAENNKRDFVYVDDINDFHLQCITDDRVDNRMFRLGSGKSYSVVDILNTIKNILQSDIEPIIKPQLSGDVPTQTLADISDAVALGWKPKTNLEEGLRAMAEFIKGEMEKGRI